MIPHILILSVLQGQSALFGAESSYRQQNELQVLGQVGVGTVLPRARMEVQLAPQDKAAITVLDSKGRIAFAIDKNGNVGVGKAPGKAAVDVANDESQAVLIRGWPEENGAQLEFGLQEPTAVRFWLSSHHSTYSAMGNSLDLLASHRKYRYQASHPTRLLGLGYGPEGRCAVQVNHGEVANSELEISTAGVLGSGDIRYGSAGQHSNLKRKDAKPLGSREFATAYDEVTALKHAEFNFKGNPSIRIQGIVFDDAPESIRDKLSSIIVDERVVNLELALKHVDARIRDLERRIQIVRQNRR